MEETVDSGSRKANRGIGICGILTFLFIILKITEYIDWSWWMIFSPLWLPLIFLLTALLVCASIIGIITLFVNREKIKCCLLKRKNGNSK